MSKNNIEKKQIIRQIKDVLVKFRNSNKLDENAEQIYLILNPNAQIKNLIAKFHKILENDALNEFGSLLEIAQKVDAIEAELLEE